MVHKHFGSKNGNFNCVETSTISKGGLEYTAPQVPLSGWWSMIPISSASMTHTKMAKPKTATYGDFVLKLHNTSRALPQFACERDKIAYCTLPTLFPKWVSQTNSTLCCFAASTLLIVTEHLIIGDKQTNIQKILARRKILLRNLDFLFLSIILWEHSSCIWKRSFESCEWAITPVRATIVKTWVLIAILVQWKLELRKEGRTKKCLIKFTW